MEIHDDMDYSDNLYLTKAGFIIPCTTGAISFLSSLIMISIIWKFRTISTGYHRIMLVMAISDIISSAAVFLSTVPIPSDVVYPFEGPTVGTIGTCTGQGLAFLIGSSMTIATNITLNIYYLLRLRFRVKEETFNKIIFPLVTAANFLVVGVALPVIYINNELINPSPYESFCTLAVYPRGCESNKEIKCRGNPKFIESLMIAFIIMFVAGLIVIFGSLGLILQTYRKNVRSLRRSRQLQRHDVDRAIAELVASQDHTTDNAEIASDQQEKPSESSHEEENHMSVEERYQELKLISQRENHFKNFTAVFTVQAVMYIGAFMLSWIFLILTFISELENLQWLQALKLIFLPLQGFFNLVVFVYNKILQIRRLCKDSTLSTTTALSLLWSSPEEIPEIVRSRLSTSHQDRSRFNESTDRHLIQLVPNSDTPPESCQSRIRSSSNSVSFSLHDAEGRNCEELENHHYEESKCSNGIYDKGL